MKFNRKKRRAILFLALIFAQMLPLARTGAAQTASSEDTTAATVAPTKIASTVDLFLDQTNGKTADELVADALANNPEIEAVRREVAAAEALIKQADLRANPTLEASGTKNPVSPSNSLMVRGILPLELYGRRKARVLIAEREAEIRRQVLRDRERLLAAEVRSKFGESLALALKLLFVEETLAVTTENYNLVSARVAEGRTAPLERNIELVELNRIRAMRETSEGKTRVALLELKNLVGLPPDAPLRLRGDFDGLLDPLPPQAVAVEQALKNRPDLLAARSLVDLAEARIEQARTLGKPDASVSAGYQRMNSGFPFQALDQGGNFAPIRSTFHFVTFGVTVSLPVFNQNQGNVQAAAEEKIAAENRVEFGELTVRHETAVAYARFESAARAMEIYRVGVENQAATNLGVVRQTYELGARTLLDYIAEQRRYIEAKNDFIDAQLETYRARVDVLKALAAPELMRK